jgi:hypothetical protein
MSNRAYQFAIIITVPADDYEIAKGRAEAIADDFTDVAPEAKPDLQLDYERDGSDLNQRVLYLHDENVPIDLDAG